MALNMVRAVGKLIICNHADCGDPRSGAVVGQVVDARYARQAIALHESTHSTPQPDPPGGDPLAVRGERDSVSAPGTACETQSKHLDLRRSP